MTSPRLSEGTLSPGSGRPAGHFVLVGHRGARGLFPENTIPAFLGGLGAGATGLELDVHVSADGVVVVCHDPWVEIAGALVAVGSLTAAELSRLDVGSRPDPEFPDRRAMAVGIPALAEVARSIAATRARPEWFVEIKSTLEGEGRLHPAPDVFASATLDSIHRHALTDSATIMSFDPRVLVALKGLEPRVALMLLVEGSSGLSVEAHVDRLGFVPDGIGPHRSLVTTKVVDWAHAAGMRVLPWTVNDEDQARSLVSMGVDGLTTDRPDLLRDVLDRSLGPNWSAAAGT